MVTVVAGPEADYAVIDGAWLNDEPYFAFHRVCVSEAHQMFYATLLTIVVIFMVSLSSNPADDDPKAIKLTADMFKTDKVFNICAYIICILLVVIYTAFF